VGEREKIWPSPFVTKRKTLNKKLGEGGEKKERVREMGRIFGRGKKNRELGKNKCPRLHKRGGEKKENRALKKGSLPDEAVRTVEGRRGESFEHAREKGVWYTEIRPAEKGVALLRSSRGKRPLPRGPA